MYPIQDKVCGLFLLLLLPIEEGYSGTQSIHIMHFVLVMRKTRIKGKMVLSGSPETR
jgi:hypothetical protein